MEQLLAICSAEKVGKLVHLSSFYVQCSSRWPNVNGRESEDYEKFRHELPFIAYCESKWNAERLVKRYSSAIDVHHIRSVCARIGPLYGEGDRCSLVCDAIVLSQCAKGPLPRIGDHDGVLQLTYAGNAAYALLKCAEKLFECDASSPVERSPLLDHEVVAIQDATPKRNIVDLILQPLSVVDFRTCRIPFI